MDMTIVLKWGALVKKNVSRKNLHITGREHVCLSKVYKGQFRLSWIVIVGKSELPQHHYPWNSLQELIYMMGSPVIEDRAAAEA